VDRHSGGPPPAVDRSVDRQGSEVQGEAIPSTQAVPEPPTMVVEQPEGVQDVEESGETTPHVSASEGQGSPRSAVVVGSPGVQGGVSGEAPAGTGTLGPTGVQYPRPVQPPPKFPSEARPAESQQGQSAAPGVQPWDPSGPHASGIAGQAMSGAPSVGGAPSGDPSVVCLSGAPAYSFSTEAGSGLTQSTRDTSDSRATSSSGQSRRTRTSSGRRALERAKEKLRKLEQANKEAKEQAAQIARMQSAEALAALANITVEEALARMDAQQAALKKEHE
jgi:hypothetical protein